MTPPTWPETEATPLHRKRRSGKGFIVAAVLVVAAMAGFVAVRSYVAKRAEAAFITAAPPGDSLPDELTLPVSRLRIPSEGRTLAGLLVRASDTAGIGTAVLLFHGNRTSIADHVDVAATLYERGISCMVFDYSGFGDSEGRATARNLRDDALAAYDMFVDSVGPRARKFALGTSIGAAVLMDVIDELQPNLDGVILVGTFASSRVVGMRQRRVPQFLSFLIPNLYDNVSAAARLRKPLLVIHSAQDELFPITDARLIAEAAGGPTRLEIPEGIGHNEYLTTAEHWEPVVDFLMGR